MKKEDINFVFWGTPDVARDTLEILKQHGYVPSLVVTSPDAKAGRKMLLTSPPAKIWAEENFISTFQPEHPEEFLSIAEEFNPDLFIVVAYGKIIPDKILNLPTMGSINIHYSLLPKYRGASPVESAILNGETETGVTIQKMEFKLDAGPVIAEEKVKIEPDETAPELRERLIKIGGELLVKTLPEIIAGKIKEKAQDESKATHSKKIKKEDGLIDPNDDSPEKNLQNYNKFRAYAAWPRTYFFKDGKRIIITHARLENGKFIIEKIIPEGGKEKDYS